MPFCATSPTRPSAWRRPSSRPQVGLPPLLAVRPSSAAACCHLPSLPLFFFLIPYKDCAALRNPQTSSIFSQRLSVFKASRVTRDRHPEWNGSQVLCVLRESASSFSTTQGNFFSGVFFLFLNSAAMKHHSLGVSLSQVYKNLVRLAGIGS